MSTFPLAEAVLNGRPTCDYCDRTDIEPAIIDIYDDEGTPTDHRTFNVCPVHVDYLVSVVQRGEDK